MDKSEKYLDFVNKINEELSFVPYIVKVEELNMLETSLEGQIMFNNKRKWINSKKTPFPSKEGLYAVKVNGIIRLAFYDSILGDVWHRKGRILQNVSQWSFTR